MGGHTHSATECGAHSAAVHTQPLSRVGLMRVRLVPVALECSVEIFLSSLRSAFRVLTTALPVLNPDFRLRLNSLSILNSIFLLISLVKPGISSISSSLATQPWHRLCKLKQLGPGYSEFECSCTTEAASALSTPVLEPTSVLVTKSPTAVLQWLPPLVAEL